MEEGKLHLTGVSHNNYSLYEGLLPDVYRIAFRRNPDIQALGADYEDKAAGIVLFTEDSELSFCRVLYIAVAPEFRRMGIARTMLIGLARSAYDEILYTSAAFLAESTHDPVYRLFETSGEFTLTEEDGAVWSSTKKELKEALKRLAAMHKDRKEPKTRKLGECGKSIRNQMIEELEREGHDILVQLHRADPELSRIYFDHEEKAKAMILIEDLVDVKGFLLSFGWTRDDPLAIMMLLIHVLADLYSAMDDDSMIRITAVDERVKEIVDKLFENKEVVSRLYEATYNGGDPM